MALILIAEDELHIVRVLSLWLHRHGHRILEARNGVEALQRLDEEPVELVISDVNMPGMDGLALVKVIREERGLKVPVLMLSARCDQMQLSKQIRGYGIQLFPKPFVPSQIVEEIDRLLQAAAAP